MPVSAAADGRKDSRLPSSRKLQCRAGQCRAGQESNPQLTAFTHCTALHAAILHAPRPHVQVRAYRALIQHPLRPSTPTRPRASPIPSRYKVGTRARPSRGPADLSPPARAGKTAGVISAQGPIQSLQRSLRVHGVQARRQLSGGRLCRACVGPGRWSLQVMRAGGLAAKAAEQLNKGIFRRALRFLGVLERCLGG